MINIKIKNIRELFKRRYTLMDLGIEIISHSISSVDETKSKRKTMYLVFKNTAERDFVYNTLHQLVPKDSITTEAKPIEYFTQQWVSA